MKRTQRKYLALAVAAAGLAQLHATSAVAEEKAYQLEQVIVTSQKSDDRVQDIPSTINVVSGEQLDQFEITKFADLSQVTAGLSLDVLTSRRQSVNLRGVETNPDAGVADGVAVYWNDLNVRTDVAFQQLFDVASIEVLRGPQGTLQGATSPAGAIHLHTRMPYLQDFSGNVSQTFSDNNGSNTEFGVDLPIIPGQLAVRVAGVYDAADVNDTKNITTGRQNTSMSKGGRFSAFYQPGEIFSAKLAYEHLEKTADSDVILSGSQAGKPNLSPYDRYALTGINNVTNNRNNIASLNLSWDLGKNQIVWETGYYNSNQVAVLDSDLANRNNNFTLNIIPQKAERLVQEARLTTDISDTWTSLVGVYYQKDSSIASPVVNNNNILLGGDFHTDLDIASHGETYAIFTHQKFQVFEDGLLELGLRYQALHQYNAADGAIILADGSVYRSIHEVTPEHTHDADAEVMTKSVKFSWTFTPDLMAYASYDQGFRPGGLTATTVSAPAIGPYLPYDEERSWGVETGIKSAWLDNRLQINADVFYQYFHNGQYRSQALLVNTDGKVGADTSTVRLVYGADSIIQGAELEVQGLITPDWSAGANVSYVDAKYDDATVPTSYTGGPANTFPANVVLFHTTSSGRVGSQPNWSATANTSYTLPLGPVDAYSTLLVKYQSSREDDSFNDSRGMVAGFATTNLYLGVRDADNVWDVSLFAKNLFNKEAQSLPPEIDGTTTYLLARPIEGRVIGITGKYKFGKS
jgi:iron complex outermembrane recepter protein